MSAETLFTLAEPAAEVGLVPGYYQVGNRTFRVVPRQAGGWRLLWVRGHTTRVVATAHPGRPVAVVACDREVEVLLADPGAAATAYARRTGRCWRCGRELTDPTSIRLGLGATCAETLGKETT